MKRWRTIISLTPVSKWKQITKFYFSMSQSKMLINYLLEYFVDDFWIPILILYETRQFFKLILSPENWKSNLVIVIFSNEEKHTHNKCQIYMKLTCEATLKNTLTRGSFFNTSLSKRQYGHNQSVVREVSTPMSYNILLESSKPDYFNLN